MLTEKNNYYMNNYQKQKNKFPPLKKKNHNLQKYKKKKHKFKKNQKIKIIKFLIKNN